MNFQGIAVRVVIHFRISIRMVIQYYCTFLSVQGNIGYTKKFLSKVTLSWYIRLFLFLSQRIIVIEFLLDYVWYDEKIVKQF